MSKTSDRIRAEAEKAKEEAQGQFTRRLRKLEDFRYDESQNKYWDITTGTLLMAAAVDGAVPREWWPTVEDARGRLKPVRPSVAINNISTGLTIETSTWWPGKPRFILDCVVNENGVLPQPGAICLNTYLESRRETSDADPGPWLDHVKFLFPEPAEHEHFFDFAAHCLQKPDEKVNHGIVIAGRQGIGKDTMLAPIRYGVGEHNTSEIDPEHILSRFNGWAKSVLLVCNEVRPYDDEHKASSFYNKLKPVLAAPPDMIGLELKHANTIHVRNLCHVVFTTNDPLSMYIPPEDRRLFVMTSALQDPKREVVFPDGYFETLHAWLANGGLQAVAGWLERRDISAFDPAVPPGMTLGKELIIGSAADVRRSPIDDVLEKFKEQFPNMDVIFAKDLHDFAHKSDLFDDAQAVKRALHAKTLHFKMEDRGYDAMRREDGSEYKSKQNGRVFRSRIAFCNQRVPPGDRRSMVEAALEKRPLLFDSGDNRSI